MDSIMFKLFGKKFPSPCGDELQLFWFFSALFKASKVSVPLRG